MRSAGLDEAQAGIKIAGRNINNLRYADDTTLMAESEEELNSLLVKVKEASGKVGLKLNIQKMKIMASGPITSWEIDGETVEIVSDFIFWGSKIHWIIEKVGEFQRNIYFCFIDYVKAFDCVDHNKRWKILKGMPDHLTCLLRNLYAGQEATVRTGHGTTDWFQIRKGVGRGMSPCLFNLYAEYIMRNARLDEAQAGIKIARRNIKNLRYADAPPLWQKGKRN